MSMQGDFKPLRMTKKLSQHWAKMVIEAKGDWDRQQDLYRQWIEELNRKDVKASRVDDSTQG